MSELDRKPSLADRIFRRKRPAPESGAQPSINPEVARVIEEYNSQTDTFGAFVEYAEGSNITNRFWSVTLSTIRDLSEAESVDLGLIAEKSQSIFGIAFNPRDFQYALIYSSAVSLAKDYVNGRSLLGRYVMASLDQKEGYSPETDERARTHELDTIEGLSRDFYDRVKGIEAENQPGISPESMVSVRSHIETFFQDPLTQERFSLPSITSEL